MDISNDDPNVGTNVDDNVDVEDSEGGEQTGLNPQGNNLPAPELSSPSLPMPTLKPLCRSNCPNKGIPPT